MRSLQLRRVFLWLVLAIAGSSWGRASLGAQARRTDIPGLPVRQLPTGPMFFDNAEEGPIKVSVTKGLNHPWSLAFLPNGDMLVTERPGRLRLIHDGQLDPRPISGVPEVFAFDLSGLMEVVVHPRFAENHFVYLSYTKRLGENHRAPALARGRLQGFALTDVRDIFVAETDSGGPAAGAGMTFGRDGNIYMSVGGAADDIAQKPRNHQGKIVRLHDDGTVPADNPFVGRDGFRPEIWTLGHRNVLGLAVNPVTGEIWVSENGPQGGDEVNVLKAGGNYGWPIVTFGREYSGARISRETWHEGMESPIVFWMPSIAPSGIAFYTGDRFPHWKNNLFVAGLQSGRIQGTGQLQRIVFNERWEHIRLESFFLELRQRIRTVRQGPDGLLYLLTDEDDGALLRIEPAP